MTPTDRTRMRFEAAMAAMQGLLAMPRDFDVPSHLTWHQVYARDAVLCADALLAELARTAAPPQEDCPPEFLTLATEDVLA